MPQTESSPISKEVEKITSFIGELPALPTVVTGVMQLTSDVNSTADKIASLILMDQVLTAKVLKLSNSAFYGRARRVSTVKEGVVLLGFQSIKSLVLASSVRELFNTSGGDEFEITLWDHALSTAICCRLIASKLRHPRIEEAFISGILHDIGKLIISRKYGDEYRELIGKFQTSSTNFHILEEEAYGFNHLQVGGSLMRKWNFPELLVEAVEYHNIWLEREEGGRHIPLNWIINFSNICSSMAGFNFPHNEIYRKNWEKGIEIMDFSSEEAESLKNELTEVFETEKQLYE